MSNGAMVRGRKPQQVAKRALILGAIAFRSSLEVTDHRRVVEISQRLLPWLSDIGCGDELDPIERELLATPLGQLSDSQRIDANWAGEGAALFCWMLKLGEPLKEASPANPSHLPVVLRILKPEAMDLLRSPLLRDRAEIEDTARQFMLIRSMLQESRVDRPGRDIVRRVNCQKLNGVGLVVTEDAVRRASEAIGRMTALERSRAAGLYFVREHSVLWFLSDRSSYFD